MKNTCSANTTLGPQLIQWHVALHLSDYDMNLPFPVGPELSWTPSLIQISDKYPVSRLEADAMHSFVVLVSVPVCRLGAVSRG